jgi:hypothetical protein
MTCEITYPINRVIKSGTNYLLSRYTWQWHSSMEMLLVYSISLFGRNRKRCSASWCLRYKALQFHRQYTEAMFKRNASLVCHNKSILLRFSCNYKFVTYNAEREPCSCRSTLLSSSPHICKYKDSFISSTEIDRLTRAVNKSDTVNKVSRYI